MSIASRIGAVIPQQNFEIILARIAEILFVELDNQVVLSYNTDLEVSVYRDRAVSFSHSELPAINVCYHNTEFSEQNQLSTSGMNLYHIDCIVKAKSEDPEGDETERDTMGDVLAKEKLNRLMGVVRAILEDPKYKTLAFTPPSIGNRHVPRMYFMKTINQDTANVRIGRIEFLVKAPEYPVELIGTLPLGGSDTDVKIAYSEETGYYWTNNS